MGYQTYGKEYMDGECIYKYKPTYWYDKYGHVKTQNKNYSHKPIIQLNHIWKIDDSS